MLPPKIDWDKQRPFETHEEYCRRTGKGFYSTIPDGATGKLGGIEIPLIPIGPFAAQRTLEAESAAGNTYWPWKDKATAEVRAGRFVAGAESGEEHYGGFATLEEMVDTFGKAKARDWCFITAYKYLSRMGKKPGNSLEQEIKKAKDYIVMGMKLTAELEQAELEAFFKADLEN